MISPTSSCRFACRVETGLIVAALALRNFRSYERLDLTLEPGVVLAAGPNGAGKTNLLEALHVGTQGFSPRTRNDSQLIRFAASAARTEVSGWRNHAPLQLRVDLLASQGKRAWVNGSQVRAAEQLRSEVATLVFTPDRLSVVKGGPAVRCAYFDRVLGRLAPARAGLPVEYGAAVAQRNASLRRVASGVSSRDALEPWNERVVALGAELVAARQEVLAALADLFAVHADELALPGAELRYSGEQPTSEALAARLDRDLERGTTSLGPHLDDVTVVSGGRDLRSFGSQGEQRLAVLALLLAEAEAIADRRGVPPLLLLDDVLSELDPVRRRVLAARVEQLGQTLVTATDASFLPVSPAQLLEVRNGEVRPA